MELSIMNVRSEHPTPSFMRENWLNLNGEWEFYNDLSTSGTERKVFNEKAFDQKIIVPFCPESTLSGIHFTDFMPSVWYAKEVEISKQRLQNRIILHIGACDYITTVYINGSIAGTHIGGYTPFSFDITALLQPGKNRLVIHAEDDVRTNAHLHGKQSKRYYSAGCDYTRTTGIWQTVWLEFLPQTYLKRVKVTATDLSGIVRLEAFLNEYCHDAELLVEIRFKNKEIVKQTFQLPGAYSDLSVQIPEIYPWEPGNPNLYDITYRLLIQGKIQDTVSGYFGIRRIDIDGKKILINGKPVFQRLILDQGFYPDGIYTAPSDEALQNDICLSMQAGFNGARLHQKVFEERFLYHADRLGYIVWGEFASWGAILSDTATLHEFLPQWIEAVERDYNHPCVVGWCPYNETWDCMQIPTNVSAVYYATKAIDPTRPVIDTSGGFHIVTDIYDVHDYDQNPESFAKRYEKHADGEFYVREPQHEIPYDGKMPYLVSEYGGIHWSVEKDESSWGYGDTPQSHKDFCKRYCELTEILLDNPSIAGFCYTQLTDIEQEQNGLYSYDRSLKFSKDIYKIMAASTSKKAAIEK